MSGSNLRDPEKSRQRYSDASKRRWADPAFRAKVRAATVLRDENTNPLEYAAPRYAVIGAKRTKIVVGDRYGKLVVIEALGRRMRSNRAMLFWLCRCECGNTIELPTVYLRNKSYTTCEECRMKTCVLCGAKYPNIRKYDFCEDPKCLEAMYLESRCRSNARKKERLLNDVEYRERRLARERQRREEQRQERIASSEARREYNKTAMDQRNQQDNKEALSELLDIAKSLSERMNPG